MDINFLVLLIVAVIMAMAYGVLGLFANWMNSGAKFDIRQFLATLVYSIVVGIIAVSLNLISLDTLANWQAIFSPIWTAYTLVYTGLLYVFGKIIPPVAGMVFNKTTFYARTAKWNPNRKMDEETRGMFFDDNPYKSQILNMVDQAESTTPMTGQYAIEAGKWVYLVEGGEVFGAKHYFFNGWLGTSNVRWKPCSDACFESIRKTCKFPEFDDLY